MKTTFQLKNKKELLILILIISIAVLSISLAYVFGYKNKMDNTQSNQPIVQEQPISEQIEPLRQDTLKGTSDEEIMTYLYGNYDKEKKESKILVDSNFARLREKKITTDNIIVVIEENQSVSHIIRRSFFVNTDNNWVFTADDYDNLRYRNIEAMPASLIGIEECGGGGNIALFKEKERCFRRKMK